MIISKLENSTRIESLHPLFHRLFEYVKEHDLLHQETGKIVLDGENLFINNSEVEGVPREKQLLEVHREYIDIHFLLSGHETIGWKALEDLKQEVQPYDHEKDFAFYADRPTTFVDVQPGEFVVIFPEDPHAPIIGDGKIRKLVAKIKTNI